MSTLALLLEQLQTSPETVEFQQVQQIIADNFIYTPCEFHNGITPNVVVSAAGTNEGSCRVFAFAQIFGLNQQQTLHCFGNYYREDVLAHPQGSDHANIRQFMLTGWDGIAFLGTPLSAKENL